MMGFYKSTGSVKSRVFCGCPGWAVPTVLAALLWSLSGCSYRTPTGVEVERERAEVVRLENQRRSLEKDLMVVLNNLERHPLERDLLEKRDAIKSELTKVRGQLIERRQFFDKNMDGWEAKIREEGVMRQMIDQEVRENRGKEF